MYYQYKFSNLQYVHDLTRAAVSSGQETDTLFKLFCLVSGEVCITFGSQQINCTQGDIVLVTPGHSISVRNLSNDPYDYYLASFTEHLIPAEITSYMRYAEGGYHLADSIIPELFRRFDWHLTNISGKKLQQVKMLFRCVLTEIVVYFSRAAGEQTAIPGMLTENIEPILDFISRNLERPLKIQDICDEFHYSRSYLCKIFTKVKGVPLIRYIRAERASYAEKLLRAGLSATEVAKQLGYTDYSSFYRLYRRYLDTKPSDTRRHEDEGMETPTFEEN